MKWVSIHDGCIGYFTDLNFETFGRGKCVSFLLSLVIDESTPIGVSDQDFDGGCLISVFDHCNASSHS
jgi:hypothetical protein